MKIYEKDRDWNSVTGKAKKNVNGICAYTVNSWDAMQWFRKQKYTLTAIVPDVLYAKANSTTVAKVLPVETNYWAILSSTTVSYGKGTIYGYK